MSRLAEAETGSKGAMNLARQAFWEAAHASKMVDVLDDRLVLNGNRFELTVCRKNEM